MRLCRIPILVTLFLSCAPESFAGDLRVLDNLGLARAFRSISAPAKVKILLKEDSTLGHVTLRLSDVDGLVADILGTERPNHSFEFSPVPEGTWRVVSEPVTAVISEVKIVQ